MLVFTARGHLIPNLNIRASVDEIKLNFVDTFATGKRQELFEKYKEYSEELKKVVAQDELLQWIDGSFVTKDNSPGDIDMVTFLPFEVVEKQEKALENFKYPLSLNNFGVDAYIVKTYPNNHPKYALYISDRAYWMEQFDKTKRNRAGNRYPKGFLEVFFK
ncbi:MAG: hypothetical protein EOP53_02100 [Sphingobacteriales bacterium]|nr:MAG: hypothetical protein EOP53_02100 [Sphingobacteriales bacterium]